MQMGVPSVSLSHSGPPADGPAALFLTTTRSFHGIFNRQ